MIGLKRASLILTLMWALCGEQAECAGLTFSIDDGPVPHDFGHRVDGVSDGITTNGGLTPNVVILYGDGVLRPLIASSGFGGSVLRINDEADGIVEVRFISEEGVDVRLLSFNVVSRAGIFDEDPIVDRIEIVDERADRVLFSEDNVRVPRGGQRMFEFLNSEDAVEGSDLLLRLDANSLSAAAINLGLDDIVFAQDPPPPGSAPTVRGSVEFPSGDASFADRVVALESDNGLTIAEDGGRVLGPPDDHTLELGDGGRLVVEFVDNVLTVSGDDQADLAIFGTSQSLVPINVAVSSDGVLWLPLGMVDGGGERGVQIDLDAVDIENDSGFRFVEIVDIADDASSAEIDAVGAIFTQRRQGGVGATFENPRGGDGFVVTGVGTSFFTWGVKVSTPFPNSLQFLPGGYSGGVETEFDVGTLTYYNGSTAPGTTVDLVTLRLSLDTGGGNDVSVFEFPLELNSTPNEGSAFENADIVRLPNVFSDVPIISTPRNTAETVSPSNAKNRSTSVRPPVVDSPKKSRRR